MGPEIFPVLFIGFVILIVILAIYAKKKEEERRAALAAFAASHGLQYLPGTLSDRLPGGFWENLFGDTSGTDEVRFLTRFAGFHPFGQGHSPEVKNLIFGHKGDLDWAIFDYSYKVTTSNGKSTQTTTYPFTIVVSRMPVLLPAMKMQPENFLHRIGAKLGMQDLQFELEEFNRKYVVQCSECQAAYDLLHPQAIEFFMSNPARLWQMAGFQILLVESGHHQPDVIAAMMSEIEAFSRLLPGYVKEDRGVSATFEGPF